MLLWMRYAWPWPCGRHRSRISGGPVIARGRAALSVLVGAARYRRVGRQVLELAPHDSSSRGFDALFQVETRMTGHPSRTSAPETVRSPGETVNCREERPVDHLLGTPPLSIESAFTVGAAQTNRANKTTRSTPIPRPYSPLNETTLWKTLLRGPLASELLSRYPPLPFAQSCWS